MPRAVSPASSAPSRWGATASSVSVLYEQALCAAPTQHMLSWVTRRPGDRRSTSAPSSSAPPPPCAPTGGFSLATARSSGVRRSRASAPRARAGMRDPGRRPTFGSQHALFGAGGHPPSAERQTGVLYRHGGAISRLASSNTYVLSTPLGSLPVRYSAPVTAVSTRAGTKRPISNCQRSDY